MKNIYFLLSICLLIATGQLSAQNDTLYVWKAGIVINKQSIKTVDVDSITFYKPTPIVPITATVNIGSQIWTFKNLDVATYRDGTVIPQVTDPTQWANLKTGAWCYYNNDAANGTTYGKLYNWYAVAGIHDTDPSTPNKKLAPVGFHIPTDAEWTTLTTFLGGESVAGGKMKATTLWQSPNTSATNSSGFTGFPGGYRGTDGPFYALGIGGAWWSSTETAPTIVRYCYLNYNNGSAYRIMTNKVQGFSIRCLTGEAVVAVVPTVSTTILTAIATTTATTGGNATADGDATVTARGVVWSTATNPTIALATKTANGTGTGAFTSSLTGLVDNTTYYVRAYATNSVGTAYGNEVSFTTLPTVVAPATVTIGTQVWTTKNLDVTTYTDGTVIPEVTDPLQWRNLKTGAWCYYNNDAANGITYGKLYNWYAIAGIHDTDPSTPNKKLAPVGFHIPTNAEWTTLTTFLGGESVAGGKMKATTLWQSPNTSATNSSGFTGLPGGYVGLSGDFFNLGNYGSWWSASEYDTLTVWSIFLNYNHSNANRNNNNKELCLSVRCLAGEAVVALASTVTTATVTAITTTTATTGGNATADGGATVTARGIVWSTSINPTIALATKTANGTGTGAFTSSLTGLVANTTYYVRAYATNSVGTAYGNEVSFTTTAIIIAQPSVTIGTQTWTTQNLNVTTYRDGTVIPQVTDPSAWANLTTGAWCYYANNTANATTYGKLYNWYAVAGIHDTDPNTPNKILAPTGYHIPTNDDWNTLKLFLGGYSVAGGKMKATGTALWASPNTAATNSSGFTGLPGGYRYSGTGTSLGLVGNWWSADELGVSGYAFPLSWDSSSADFSFYDKVVGVSVRCLRD